MVFFSVMARESRLRGGATEAISLLGSAHSCRGREDRPNDRVRAIHFMNLPPVCTIRIYSLDGDLVRELPHSRAMDDATHREQAWDLIGRNTQAVVSGIYYWTVEDTQGKVQIGKLVIIM